MISFFLSLLSLDNKYYLGFPGGKELACQWRRPKTRIGSLGEEDPLEEVMTTYSSCLENPLDRGTWWATVHRIAQSRTWLKWLSTQAQKVLSTLYSRNQAEGKSIKPLVYMEDLLQIQNSTRHFVERYRIMVWSLPSGCL